MHTDEINMVYVTTSNAEEAERIGRAMVEQRLAACANILPSMKSIYHWEGALCEDEEVVLLLKTHLARVEEVIAGVKNMHSYDCPCVLALRVESGNAPYLEWVARQVGAITS